MPFTVSGTTITQSGVDTDLSGLASLPEVSASTFGGHTVYSIAAHRLAIAGTLNIDPETEELFFGTAVPLETLTVDNGGILNVGSEIDVGANLNRFSGGTFVRFARTTGSGFRESDASLRVNGGGTLNWFGGALFTSNVVAFMENSNVNIFSQQAQLIAQRLGVQIRQRSENTDIRGLITRGFFMTLIANPIRLDGWSPFDSGSGQALSFSSGSADNVFHIIGNFDPSGLSGQHVAYWSNVWGRLIGNALGSGVVTGGNSDNNNLNLGLYEIRQPTEITVSAFSGETVEGVKVYCVDTDNGERLAPNTIESNLDYLVDREYSHTFDATGQHTFDEDGGILTALTYRTVGGQRTENNERDYRSLNNDSTDVFQFVFGGYGYNIGVANVSLRGLGGTTISQTLFDDTSITQRDRSIVDAYTDINNSREFYDRFVSVFLETSTNEQSFGITRSGDLLDLGSRNLTIDASATEVFQIDDAGDITIRSGDFDGSITTAGIVTLENGSTVSGNLIDVNGAVINITSPNGLPFNILARRADTGAEFAYQHAVLSASFQVPVGVELEVAAWQLGKQTSIFTTQSSTSISFIDHTVVDTDIDTSPFTGAIDLSLAPNDFGITFNQSAVFDIELMKAIIHKLLGRENSLRAGLLAGAGSSSIEILSDEIRINLPIVFVRRGASLTVAERVELSGFLNIAPARALNPLYIPNPNDANNQFVLIPSVKPALDPSQLAKAVWDENRAALTLDHSRAANQQTKLR